MKVMVWVIKQDLVQGKANEVKSENKLCRQRLPPLYSEKHTDQLIAKPEVPAGSTHELVASFQLLPM